MSDIEQLAGIGGTISADGQEYELSPLRVRDYAALRKWAKQWVLDDAKETITMMGDAADEQTRREIISESLKAASDPLSGPAMSSPEVVQEWLYLSLRANHPAMDRAKAASIADASDLDKLTDMLTGLSTVDGAEENPTSAGEEVPPPPTGKASLPDSPKSTNGLPAK